MKLAKLAPLAALVFVAAALSGRAYAYLSATGEGVGSAATAIVDGPDPIEVEAPGTAVVEPLFPDGTGDLIVAVRNTNPFPVAVRRVSVPFLGPFTGSLPGCTAALEIASHDFVPSEPIDPDETVEIRVEGAVHMPADAPSECQGATFALAVDVEIVTVTA